MSAKNKALDDMKAGVPWKEITKMNSKSSVYRAYDEFLPFMEKEIENIRDVCKQVTLENVDLLEENEKIKAQRDESKRVFDTCKVEALQCKAQLETIETELGETSETLEVTKTELGKLESRGLTIEFLESIAKIDFVDNKDLISRISTIGEFQQVKKEIDAIITKRETEEKAVEALQKSVRSLTEEEKSYKNKITITKSEHHLYSDAIEITKKALENYSKATLLQLLKHIKRIEVRGEPKTSLKYLLNRLDSVKEEAGLDARIVSKTAELESITGEVNRVNGVYVALEKGVIKHIEDTQLRAQNAIEGVAQKTINNIDSVEKAGINSLNVMAQASQNQLNSKLISGEKRLDQLQSRQWTKTFNLTNLIEAKIGEYSYATEKWGQLREETGRYDYYLRQTILLCGPLNNAEDILSLDPQFVRQAMHRIHLYVTKRLPGVKTKTPKHIADKEYALSDIWELNLSSISEFLALDFDKFLSGAARANNPGRDTAR